VLIIPFDKKLNWRSPPVITFLLIVINTIVYFGFQFHDDEKSLEARHFYYRSGLDEIELPRFKEALIEQGEQEFVQQYEDYIQKEYGPWYYQMQANAKFINALQTNQIILPTDPIYKQWKSKRQELNNLLSESVTWKYSLKAAAPTLTTIISHMFLHGDFSHLLGNMIFLLAVGFIVELSMNRYLFLTAYLLSGIGSALLYIPSASDSLILSLGASGAIAGLMGMYALLFNTRKVRFFYFIGFYFDYVKLPAVYLFALWLGYEVFKQISYAHISNVNYLAHIGGLLSGGLIAYTLSKFKTIGINNDYLDESKTVEQFDHTLKQADHFIRDLHFEKAVPLLAQLLEQQPKNREVLIKYYKTSKLNIGSDEHHHAAIQILTLGENDFETDQLIIKTFNDYRKVPKARLTISLMDKLIKRFIKINAFDDAENIAKSMQKQPDKFVSLPQYLRLLINELIRSGNPEKAKKHSSYLLTNFPDHQETQIAQGLIS